MKNFLIFCIVALVLGGGGYFGYRVYYQGDTVGEATQRIIGDPMPESSTSRIDEATDLYRVRDYPAAAKVYESVMENHDAGEPGGKIPDEQYEKVLTRTGQAFFHAYTEDPDAPEADEYRRKAKQYLKRALDEFPRSRYARSNRNSLKELDQPQDQTEP